MTTTTTMTHEAYVHAVARIAIARLTDPAERDLAQSAKIIYGVGEVGVRGVTYFIGWKACKPGQSCNHDHGQTAAQRPLIEIGARHQEDWVQLAGTTIHEIAHVVAGLQAAHGPLWKAACERLGLRRVLAGGTNYVRAHFAPDIRHAIAALPIPDDGQPGFGNDYRGARGGKPRGCSFGVGSRGGKSRGAGSGSRLRKFVCDCDPPLIIRASRDDAACTCTICGADYHAPED